MMRYLHWTSLTVALLICAYGCSYTEPVRQKENAGLSKSTDATLQLRQVQKDNTTLIHSRTLRKGVKVMNQGDLNLSIASFFASPEVAAGDFALKLVDNEERVLFLDAPSQLDVDEQNTLPMVVVRATDNLDAYNTDLDANAVIILSNLDSGEVYGALAMYSDRADNTEVDFEEDIPPPPGWDGAVGKFEARRLMDMPWSKSRYTGFVIIREQRSNTVAVALNSNVGAYQDPEVEKLREAEKNVPRATINTIYPKIPDAESDLYSKIGVSPALPTSGISISIPRLVERYKGDRPMLHGSFQLPVRPWELLQDSESNKKTDRAILPKAIVPLSIVFVGADKAGPTVLSLKVPVYGELNKDGDTLIGSGFFNLDLSLDIPFPKKAQTYFAYAVAGDFIGEPQIMAVVSNETLAQ